MLSLLKKAIVPVAVVALVGGLAACANAASGKADVKGALTIWVMGDSGTNFKKLVAPFTKSTGITVKVVAIPWGNVSQKLTTAVASGSGPDVVQVGLSSLRTFADAGALMDLSNKLSGYANLASTKFEAGVAGKATAIKGKIVSVPWIADTRVLFYRTDILSAAGINNPPKTWTELRADAKILTARGAGKYGYYIPQWDNALPVELTWGAGGDVINRAGNVDLNTPAFKAAVDLYTGLYADKSVPSNSDFDQTQGFISGIAPMLVSGPYLAQAIKTSASNLAGKWNVTVLPSDKTNTSLFAGSNLGVWHNTKRPKGSLKLLDFLSMPSTQLRWYAIDGSLPTVKVALADPKFTSDPLVKVYSQQLKNAKLLPLISNYDGGLGSDILKALNSIALTGADKASTLTALYQATAGMTLK
jgi:multiple sugar transport system substrate-binding protein